MRRTTRAFLLAVTILLLSAGLASAADNQGVIQGKLTNGTEGSTSSVGNMEITLKTYVNDAETASTLATTGAEGNFSFSGLATDSTYTYQLTLRYQEADYSSEFVQFAEGETSQTVDMTVYDAIAEDTYVAVPASWVVVDIGEGGLNILEAYHFDNQGDRTYVGARVVTSDGRMETLRFPLPRGAAEFQLGQGLMECCVVFSETGIGFVDTMAVIPEQLRTITFGYQLKYTSSQQALTHRIEYPTTQFELWVQQREGVEVTADQLSPLSPFTYQGVTYLRFGGQDLASGETIAVTLSGLPYSSFQQSFKWIALGLAAVALVGLGVGYPLFRKRRTAMKVAPLSSPRREREELLRQIARLDDDFEAGKLSEADYRRLRSQKKARLVELSRKAGGRG